MTTRNELVVALAGRYALGSRADRGRILDEFASLTGHHRKHAMRLLRAGVSNGRSSPRPERRMYDQATREALIVVWEGIGPDLRQAAAAADANPGLGDGTARPSSGGARGSGGLADDERRDDGSGVAGGERCDGRTAAPPFASLGGDPAQRHGAHLWRLERSPAGFMKADLVAHSGPTAKGSFVQTLTLTDIATGWTECAPVLVREQKLLTAALSEMRKVLPFALVGFDTDNDSVFMNETVRDYCTGAGVEFTRSRPYRKNDQAWVEQKNGAVVRHIVGYRRYEGLEAAAALAELYRSLRLFVNFFQPSFKLAEKSRDGAKVTKRYHPPATPHQRLISDPRTTVATRERLAAVYATLDPVQLLSAIRTCQQRLVEIADRPLSGETLAQTAPTLEEFLSGLQTTSRPKEKIKRGRRRPDPLVAVTAQLHDWFEAEPWRTARELLDRLQDEQPGDYAVGLLRTLQRRLKNWRRDAETIAQHVDDAPSQ
jgi:hypothetical protein